MQWNDTAIVLSTRKYGENSALVRVFAHEHGVFGGVVRGASSKNTRGIIQAGNMVDVHWSARLEEQLGSLKLEMVEPVAALIMHQAERLAALTSLCTLVEVAFVERHPYAKFFGVLSAFLRVLKSDEDWQEAYIRCELELLSAAGFGLDLRNCAATGETKNLVYVSPKSGRAVSQPAGLPYHEKLLPLPAFLLSPHKKNLAESAQILDGMRLTGYFLEHWLLAGHHRKLPAARARLLQIMNAEQLL